MKTEVEKFMEKEGKPMSPHFKVQSTEQYILWRQGKVKNAEFEAESRCNTK